MAIFLAFEVLVLLVYQYYWQVSGLPLFYILSIVDQYTG